MASSIVLFTPPWYSGSAYQAPVLGVTSIRFLNNVHLNVNASYTALLLIPEIDPRHDPSIPITSGCVGSVMGTLVGT